MNENIFRPFCEWNILDKWQNGLYGAKNKWSRKARRYKYGPNDDDMHIPSATLKVRSSIPQMNSKESRLLSVFVAVFALLLFDPTKGCHPAFPIGISPYLGPGPVGVVNPNDWATVKPQLLNQVKRREAGDATEEKMVRIGQRKSDRKKRKVIGKRETYWK